jgi:hypothetical protein
MYKVIKSFHDSQDNMHTYKVGKPFPREGFEPTDKRFEELSSENNKVGEALILKVSESSSFDEETVEYPQHVGGGYYKLSNGEKLRGKENAHKAQKKIEVGDNNE